MSRNQNPSPSARPTAQCETLAKSVVVTQAAEAALTSISLAELGFGSVFFLEELRKELISAKESFERLESSGWGPHASKELLSSIRHTIGGTMAIVEIVTVLSVLGEPKDPAPMLVGRETQHIEETLRGIQAASQPLDAHSHECPATPETLTEVLVGAFADVYEDLAKRDTIQQLAIARSVVEATVGPQLKASLFGARITAEILQDMANLKCLERALCIRVELVAHLERILKIYGKNNPLAASLKP
ncbi:hypothetical protein B0H17DRAFT_1212922 [Mycena rosella]|uniref:Uncharacterized protein n=1 Tax=Mycena rosella TaxID=1033263 RepID=A0AAD7CRE1_MYCRO|nr:hypothetical protein B0H17DRAFT_1212922 [Mycena rosella]